MSVNPKAQVSINLSNLFSKQATVKVLELATTEYLECPDQSAMLILNGEFSTHTTGTSSTAIVYQGTGTSTPIERSCIDTGQATGNYPFYSGVGNALAASVVGNAVLPILLIPGQRIVFTGHANARLKLVVIQFDLV